jgi:hypothetical protein
VLRQAEARDVRSLERVRARGRCARGLVVAEDGAIEISNEGGQQHSSVFGIVVTPRR